MEKYTIGLDLGLNNVGWSILNNETNKFENYGVRLFNQSSDAKDRRTFRNSRRRLKRTKLRVSDILNLAKEIGFPFNKIIDEKLIEKRYLGIKEKISKQDIVNILTYMAENRGYIPFNDDVPEGNIVNLNNKYPCEFYYDLFKETGKYKALSYIVKNTDNIREIKQMFEVQSKYYPEINNNFIGKFFEIFSRKRKFWEGPGGANYNQLTPFGRFKTEEDVEQYLKQKEENPEYEKFIFEDLVGNCKININEKCAPKVNYYAEEFDFINDFINISFDNIDKVEYHDYLYLDDRKYKLTNNAINSIKTLIINSRKVVIKEIFKKIPGTTIDNINGMKRDDEGTPVFGTFKFYRYVKNNFEDKNLTIDWMSDIDDYNKVVYYLTIAPGYIELKNMIGSDKTITYKFTDDEYRALAYIKKNKNNELNYHSLSENVLKRAINDMQKYQINFTQVRIKEDYDKEAREYFQKNYTNKNGLLPIMDDKHVDSIIASPQVKKTLRQAIKIINAVIKEKGYYPDSIAIESVTELNSRDRKAKIEKAQKKQEKLRKEVYQEITSLYGEDKADNNTVERLMLYNETNGHCLYCGLPMDKKDTINGVIQIEHIIPRSQSFDNSFDNKIMAHTKCNNEKGNNTPYAYLYPKGRYDEFKARVDNFKDKMSSNKIYNLLFEGNIDKYSIRFINRNLRDTAYATSELVNQIKLFNEYLKYKNIDDRIQTLSIPGQITKNIRDKYNLIKNRDDGKHHHAVDASIIASITNTPIGKVMLNIQNDIKYLMINKDKVERQSELLFNLKIDDQISSIKSIDDDNTKLSSQTYKNPQGQLANSNIYKIITKDDQTYKIQQFDNIYAIDFTQKSERDRFEKTLENKNFLCYDNDKELFNLISEVYNKYKNEKGNPFVNYVRESQGLDSNIEVDGYKVGIRVPTKKGNGPFVKRLRYYTTINDPYYLNKINRESKAIVALDSLSQMLTQVYFDKDNKKFVFLPVYSISVNLKTKEVNTKNEFYKQYYEKYIGDKNIEHIIDLYNGDYIEVIKSSKETIEGFVQYFDKTNNIIILKNGTAFRRNDRQFTLYSFDVLGKKYKRLTYKAY